MRIEDIDEFEGLTLEMIWCWLKVQRDVQLVGDLWVWNFADTLDKQGPVLTCGDLSRLSQSIIVLSAIYKRSPQSLLREINPRMRAGWPTDEELERHAFWMVRTLSDDGIRVLGAYVAREWKRAGIKVECWPCDQHGNKTRRGA